MNSGEKFASAAGGFRLWVDADACPREVRDLILRTAVRRRVAVVFVANSPLPLPESEYVSLELVPPGFDKADDRIVERIGPVDVAVTGDIPLAARLVEKGVLALNPRGKEYDAASIGESLATRNLMEELRSVGLVTGGPKQYNAVDLRNFANALDRVVTKRLKGGVVQG